MDSSFTNQKHGLVHDRAFLFSLLQKPESILLESSRQDNDDNRNLLFHSPVDVMAIHSLDELPQLFKKVDDHRRLGRWIAGYIGYECGYHFESFTPAYTHRSSFPLAWLCAYDKPYIVPPELLEIDLASPSATISRLRFSIEKNAYTQKIERIKEYIRNGDTYQVNFTDRAELDITGDEVELYFLLREKQHVPFAAFLNLGEMKILSYSPELFFRRSGNRLLCKPMKGTARRGMTADEDAALMRWLPSDEKNRSENLMIVDLLRNDIGRICEPGSVTVTDMFRIEAFETVLQMTSTISGLLPTDISSYDIFRSLFPCGSVTGAPKIRTMQIIRELEEHARGVYCGAIGFFAPQDDAVFSVAIRTIECNDGKGTMGLGSGIVYDSQPEKEYDECLLKAKFLLQERPRFHLLETMAWEDGYTFLNEHIARMKKSADYFRIPWDTNAMLDKLRSTEVELMKGQHYRIRLLLGKSGRPDVEYDVIPKEESFGIVKIASDRTDSSDLFLYHKTTNRGLYNRYAQKAKAESIDDYLFLNERGEVTEGSFNSLFVEIEGALRTPPLSCGLLPGIYRDFVLRTNRASSEKILYPGDLRRAKALYLCNSVRGWRKVSLSE